MISLMIHACFEGNDHCGIFFLHNPIFLPRLLGLAISLSSYPHESPGKRNLLFK